MEGLSLSLFSVRLNLLGLRSESGRLDRALQRKDVDICSVETYFHSSVHDDILSNRFDSFSVY